jgi:exonuclease I
MYVEQRIYDGFPCRDDEARLATFHRHEWPHRIGVIPSIEDGRYCELGERVIATEQPQLLTRTQRSRWQVWRRERITASGDNPWLTVPRAMADLDELAETMLGEQEQQLSDIRNLLTSLGRKCTEE